ncbi:MAG: hypothetical protein H7067_10020 [Burkholderiales bacterium]|nr:hypothetical protein [Opitutaceae bacterium]
MSLPVPSTLENLAPDDDAFLRALVKGSRQRVVHLKWTDRDGTPRLTALTAAEATRINALARAQHLGPEALLRATAHLPAK